MTDEEKPPEPAPAQEGESTESTQLRILGSDGITDCNLSALSHPKGILKSS